MRKLELARAMAAEPKLLIADESMAGLSHSEIEDILKLLVRLNERGVTIILIEHIMSAVMSFSQRLVVLVSGKKIADGAAATRSCAIPRWRGPTLANSITISGVHAGYGAVRVLEDVSLDVRPGETVVLLGTNGNGKSTLMKCIMGIVRPSAGTIVAEIDGARTSWSAARPRRSSISASRWCPRGGACSRSSPSRRTCCSARSARPRARQIERNLDFCYDMFRPAEGAARTSSPAA